MLYKARKYAERSVALSRKAAARLDRLLGWTFVPLLMIVLFSAPIWSSAAVHFVSNRVTHSDSLRVPILVYHTIAPTHPGQSTEQRLLDVDTAMFRQQMRYLVSNRYNVIPLGTLIDALQGHGSVPPRSVVITFDDGWLSQYENAFPVLREMHLTATFFVISQQVGKGSMYMDLAQVKTLQQAGMTIASHSRTHPDLTKESGAQLRNEVLGSREELQKMLGITIDLFAYPYGARNTRVEAAVDAAGYRAARAYPGGAWNDISDRFALHSVLAPDDMSAFEQELGPPVVATRPSMWRVAVAARR